jgi:hypothetical protein
VIREDEDGNALFGAMTTLAASEGLKAKRAASDIGERGLEGMVVCLTLVLEAL